MSPLTLQHGEPVAGSLRTRPLARHHKGRDGAKAGSPALRHYLQALGETPLLDEREEVALARQLRSARLGIAALARGLPDRCRAVVLAGDESGPMLGAGWPLTSLEHFLRKLTDHVAERPKTSEATVLRKIRDHKTLLDEARDALILANLRLVVHIAKRYTASGLPFVDLIQDGNLGLLRAVEKFSHQRGFKFSTYAFWWIKQGVERGIATKSRMIRLPVHVNHRLRKVELAARELNARLRRQATPREIAKQVGMPVATVAHTLSIVREPLRLEDGPGDGDSYDLTKCCPDVQSPSPFAQTSQNEIKQRVESVLRILTSREETILRLRFGFETESPHTLEQVGERLQLSRERVRQIESVALKKIRASPLSRSLVECLRSGVRTPTPGTQVADEPVSRSTRHRGRVRPTDPLDHAGQLDLGVRGLHLCGSRKAIRPGRDDGLA